MNTLETIRKTWTKIGYVGVDSGQLLLCDPGYIDSQWRQGREGESLDLGPVYRDVETGQLWACRLHRSGEGGVSLFGRFDDNINGSTPNEHIKSGRWVAQPHGSISTEFSYKGCCHQTSKTEHGAGSLVFELGHEGAGVAFRSGYGDGCYEVYALINEEGLIIATTVIM